MSFSSENRFGSNSFNQIEEAVRKTTPQNTVRSKKSAWEQFSQFLLERKYKLERDTSPEDLSKILEDYGYNMKKKNGEDYKESSIKSLWNTTAQMVQDKYYKEFDRKIDPFQDIIFKSARLARDAKRRQLQAAPEKRKASSKAFTLEQLLKMAECYEENNPDGLQKIFFHICSFELAWRGNEAANCKMHYFQKELDLKGDFSGRVEYNPIFSKTSQGGSKALTNSKWLVKNKTNERVCPVRLYLKLMEKRATNPSLTTERLFLTVNPNWEKGVWYKNMPLGINSISKWTNLSAEKIGLDTKKCKITNHSHRSSAISTLARKGVGDQELIKLTGHSSTNSLKPYLQLNPEHHLKLIENLREEISASTTNATQVQMQTNSAIVEKNNAQIINYNNCNFYINK